MTDPTLKLLADLVRIDSVNPSLSPGGAGEAAVAERVAQELTALGLWVTVTEVAPGRPNVVGVLDGTHEGRTLLLCGHSDTVGVAGMTAPFEPAVRDGRLYGRGAQDMKGGLAAMIGTARSLVESGGLAAGRLVVAAVVDEEHASLGADALVGEWKADAAVFGEPTDLAIGVAHKGFAWVEVDTTGRAAHGSRPGEGRDAVMRMGRVLARLEQLDLTLQQGEPHPLLGHGSLHASTITGGQEWSIYPDQCRLQLERRLLVDERPEQALHEVEAILEALREEDAEFRGVARLVFGRPGYQTPPAHPLPSRLAAALSSVGREPRIVGTTFWTDAAILGAAGIPSVVFGPGGEGLHSLEEYVRLDEVIACRDALVVLARDVCRPDASA